MLRVLLFSLVMAGCSEGSVYLPVTAEIPKEIASISSGVLRLELYVYDPMVADGPAALASEDSVLFSHTIGSASTFNLRVAARIPAGHEYYMSATGYELLEGCRRYVLWDGPSNEPRRYVVMQPVSNPVCVR